VARNYAGAAAVLVVSAGILGIGLLHRSTILDRQRMLDDVVARAEAYIGDRAPAAFRVNAAHTDTFTIQAGSVYRTCVPSSNGRRTYCVIVKPKLPLAQSVVFAGYEPNWLFAEGAN
jgi:3-methyladenine DNA glycosylase Mpg